MADALAKHSKTGSGIKATPMMEQYLRIKEEHPGALLFFRMGDFYELFFEDAEIAARDLDITLTARHKDSDNPVPMCGVPFHAAENYLSKLLEKGRKVAVCDQVEDPKKAKGLVKREVTRVLTPGTVVEDLGIRSAAHNFLAALYYDDRIGAGGLAWIDNSTGEWSGLQDKSEERLWQWAEKLGPREVLLPSQYHPPKDGAYTPPLITPLPVGAFFDKAGAERKILEAQSAVDLSVLDVDDKPELVRAMGALLSYLRQTLKSDLTHLGAFSPIRVTDRLFIDEVSERNLEIFRRMDGAVGKGTLFHVVDHSMTPMGARLLGDRLRRPWKELAPITKTQNAVEFFIRHPDARAKLRELLDRVFDIERLSTRIFLGRGGPRDMVALRGSLAVLPHVRLLLEQELAEISEDKRPAVLVEILSSWDDLQDQYELLEKALLDSPPPLITEGGLFKHGYTPELDEILDLSERGEAKLSELLAEEKAACGLDKLKMGFNKVFGYYFELPRAAAVDAPEHFIRRQTLTNSERFITENLKAFEEKMFQASDKRKDLEHKLFLELLKSVAEQRPRFMDMAARAAALDYQQSLAEAASLWSWCRPSLHKGREMIIRAGRHPIVEAVQAGVDYIPNDTVLLGDTRILLVTGPNMAGKSTVLRQAALIQILAQIGSFVPATQADLGLCDRIFSRVGASDNLAQGRSTFMVEMTETARILRQAGKRSLVILDEIGRGTSTYDGMALARAVVEDLAAKGDGGVRTLFATHYHELTDLESSIACVRNFNVAVQEYKGDIVFLRRMVPGPADRSYGIEVAKLAGVPQGVVNRAKAILADLEAASAKQQGKAPARVESRRETLPGLAAPTKPPLQSRSEEVLERLAQDLESIDVDRMTPLEALNLLQHWKSTWIKKNAS
jgi:DNA mismatch repair protein MutS